MNSGDNELVSAIGISDVLAWLRSNWVAIFGATSVFLAVGIVYIAIVTPKFRVETLLAPERAVASQQLLNQFGAQLGALGLGGVMSREALDQTEVSIAILESRQFLGDFIVRHNLMPVLFASRWDKKSKDWAAGDDSPPTINDGFSVLSEDILFIDRDELSGLVTVSMEWSDARIARDWLVSLISDLNEDIRQRESDEATKSLEFLRRELKRTDVLELQQALHQLSLVALQKLTMANIGNEFAFKTIDPPYLPDVDDPVWPKPMLILFGCAIFGLFAGIAFASLRTAWRLSFRND